MSGTPEEPKPIVLQLGDIIDINAPGDENLNNKRFVVRYIDSQTVRLENKEGERLLSIIDGRLENESIVKIVLVDREDYPGYARQVGLLPNKFVDIYIGGSEPFKISGQIKDLVNDQIEIVTSDNQTLYIDFAYKGIPLDIPIINIDIRDENIQSTPVADDPSASTPVADDPSASTPVADDPSASTPIVEYTSDQETSEQIVFRADEIEFGEVLGSLKNVVDLPDSEKRFHIDKQTDDMLNIMMSTIPNTDRKRNVINDIHTMINRFKELREDYSELNKNDNSLKPIKFDDNLSIDKISLELNRILEKMILKNPDQWIWTHDRWK